MAGSAFSDGMTLAGDWIAFVLDKKDLFMASFLILEVFLLALPKLRRKYDAFEANILTGTRVLTISWRRRSILEN